MSLYFVGQLFAQTKTNPFDNDLPYTNKWIMLQLLESADFKLFTGGGTDGIFQLIITKANADWEYKVFDFIQYESEAGKDIIVSIAKQDYAVTQRTYDGHIYRDSFLRPYEHKILMHSPSKENYPAISRDKCLKSWDSLKQASAVTEEKPIVSLLGDPPDYSDYIMFTNGGISAERVLSSRQKGRIEMGLDVPYTAGARLNFDAARVAADGLLVRDGAHLKVKDILPLDRYLLWIATPDALGISENTSPRIFAEKADLMFQERFGIALNCDTSSQSK